MSTNPFCKKTGLGIGFGLMLMLSSETLVASLACTGTDTTPPTAIQDLVAISQPGSTSADLSWTAPADDTSGPVSFYILKYQPNQTIASESDFNLIPPPFNLVPPAPQSPGLTETLSIDNLTQGVSYYFVFRSADACFNESPLSNVATAYISGACTAQSADGEGSAALIPNPIPTGVPTMTTMTFTTGNSGIGPGGNIKIRVPDFSVDATTNPIAGADLTLGLVTFTSTSTAFLTLSASAQVILVNVESGMLLPDEEVQIYYQAYFCDALPSVPFRMFTQQGQCGQSTELISGSPTVDTSLGPPQFIGVKEYNMTPLINSSLAIDFQAHDGCGNATPVTSNTDVTFSAKRWSGNTLISDTVAQLDDLSDMSSPAGSVTIPLISGTSLNRVYYKITDASFSPNNLIEFTYPRFPPQSGSEVSYINIHPVSSGLTNVTIDNGVQVTGQTSLSISPDGDGVDDEALIRFDLPTDLSWDIAFSTDNFTSITQHFFGYGQHNVIAWGGMIDNPFGPPFISPPDTYSIKISAGGGSLTDTSLSLTIISLGMTGRVLSGGSPLENARVEVFNSSGFRSARTAADGTFTLYGFSSGQYDLEIKKEGYSSHQTQTTLSAGIKDLGDISLTQEAVARIIITRPITGFAPEIWGHVEAFTSDWSKQAFGTLHFGNGKSESDAGDFFNNSLTTYTPVSLAPGSPYTLRFAIEGLGVPNQTVTLNNSEIRDITIAATRRASIEGTISLPAGSNTDGVWVNIDAGPDANDDFVFDDFEPDTHFWGGTWIPGGQTQGFYRILGVANGKYLLEVRAPGYVQAVTSTTVSGVSDATGVDFPTLSLGGTLSGTITIHGDTRPLDDDNDGIFKVPINAWSPTSFGGSFTELSLAPDASLVSATYQLSGLEDGTYEVFLHLAGFEPVPPGRKLGTISGATGSLDLTFQQNSGELMGDITLPSGNADISNVTLELLSFDPSAGGNSPQVLINGNQYSFKNLGTNFYTVRAFYSTTGLLVEKTIQITNGKVTTLNLDLTGATYSLSGRITTGASSPYNSLSYIVNQTTPTPLYDGSSTTSAGANRIVAFRLNGRDFNDELASQAPSTLDSNALYDPKTTFFGFFDSNGDYVINNLSPGAYLVINNGEMNGNFDGLELAEISQKAVITNTDLTDVNFTLSDGFNVTGTVRVNSGISESGREIRIELLNRNGEPAADTRVFLTGTSGTFTLERVPPGNYVLSAQDNENPIKYTAQETRVDVVSSNITGKEIILLKAGTIQGQLRIKTSGVLISASNFSQFLANNFFIQARANPWFPGGFYQANYPLIDSEGKFNIPVNEGTYDVEFRTGGFIGESAISEGKKQFVPVTLSGIDVKNGQTVSLGVVELSEGIQITGAVSDPSGIALANVIIRADPSFEIGKGRDPLEALTNQKGEYTLHGIDSENVQYYDIYAAPRGDPADQRVGVEFGGTLYGEVVKRQVDTQKTTTMNFTLQPALGRITGTIVTPDGGNLEPPFDDDFELGAILILNKQGDIPVENPLGDIESVTLPDGSFTVKGLTPGVYDMWALAKNYGGGVKKNITVDDTAVDIGNLVLSTGATLSGSLQKPDGTEPSNRDFDAIIGIQQGFRNVLIGGFETDSNGTILGYTLTGFGPTDTYDILLLSHADDVIVLESNLTVRGNTEKDFTIRNKEPDILTQSLQNPNNEIVIQYEFTDPLRNSSIDLDGNGAADDDEAQSIISLISGNGTLTYPTNWLSRDRQRAHVTYAPASGETSFILRVNATFNAENSSTGANFSTTEDFQYFLGIGRQKTKRFTNVGGGVVGLEDDTSQFSAQAGTFGTDTNLEVDVVFRSAQTTNDLTSISSLSAGAKAMAIAKNLGMKAYPGNLAGAMSKAILLDVSPLSSFYDVFLPATVSHSFPSGKEAQICLAYSTTTATDPYSLNIYYYNSATNEYVLEDQNKSVDTDNQRVCASISHASAFTLLASSDSILSGTGYSGELEILNFPNPFNLKSKTVTLQNPGSGVSASQTIQGTMIKFSIPPDQSGEIEIKIFNVLGEEVRTLKSTVASGGSHNYMEWDGTNNRGRKVASGTYIAQFKIGGGSERFFKMTVLK